MKKKLFMVFLMVTALLLIGSMALADGTACPNCGSTDRGYVQGTVPGEAPYHMLFCSSCAHMDTSTKETCTSVAATCVAEETCSVCKQVTGPVDPDAHVWGEWWRYSSTQHIRVCDLSGSHREYAPHTGGDDSCSPVCDVCETTYPPATPGKHVYSEWLRADDTQHYHFCTLCNDPAVEEYEPHYGGTATCLMYAICEGCSIHYGNLADHSWSEWESADGSYHIRFCQLPECGIHDLEAHSYDNEEDMICNVCDFERTPHTHVWGPWVYEDGTHVRTCQTDHKHKDRQDCVWRGWEWVNYYTHARQCEVCTGWEEDVPHRSSENYCMPTCEDCHNIFIPENPGPHKYGNWYFLNDKYHGRHCELCGDPDARETAEHYGGTATCLSPAICEGCSLPYRDKGDHIWGKWQSNGDGTHTRTCLNDAGHTETADCSGGTASCQSAAICENCGEGYGAKGEHDLRVFGGTGTSHTLKCHTPDCGYTVNEDCTYDADSYTPNTPGIHKACCIICNMSTIENCNGAPTCTESAYCDLCKTSYGDPLGHAWSLWMPRGDELHYRKCANDEGHYELEGCYGGTSTCTEQATCEACGGLHEIPLGHLWSDWSYNGDGTHTRTCGRDATHIETAACSGGDGSCLPICEVCSEMYGPLDDGEHNLTEWVCVDETRHVRYCADCGSISSYEYGEHNGTYNCEDQPFCTICNSHYGDALGHKWGAWVNTNSSQHMRQCSACGDLQLEDHAGGIATCYSPRICNICGEGYGSPDNSGVSGHPDPVIEKQDATCLTDGYWRITCDHPNCSMPFTEFIFPATGHCYEAKTVASTCTKSGYTEHTCSDCGDAYTDGKTNARGHWYDQWYPNGDGTHSAKCKRGACTHEGTTECTLYEVTVRTGDEESVVTVCPVCGDHQQIFVEIPAADIRTVYRNIPLPQGEKIVRGLEAPYPGVLHAFTVAYESAGRVEAFNGKVQVILPLAEGVNEAFRLVRVDVTPATEDDEARTEIWTDVPFTFENNQLIFETDAAGLFLLVPAE